MPLPKINTPTYELTLPSNRKKVNKNVYKLHENE